ncbi:MAG: type 1 glutamine amidotransferase [Gammaproteobacteria bacterium]
MDYLADLTVIQHTSADYLGLIEDHLEGRKIRFRYHRPFTERGGIPRPQDVADGLILLGGGPWGSAGPRNVPTLVREVELAHACLERDLPVVGIGLGAQILALAAGGRSHPAPLEFRVGMAERSVDDALGGYLPERYLNVVYMRDAIETPPAARVLAVEEGGAPALFQLGERSFGFSGHPGFKAAIAEDLLMEFEEEPADPADGLIKVRAMKTALEDQLVPIMTGLVQATGWMG